MDSTWGNMRGNHVFSRETLGALLIILLLLSVFAYFQFGGEVEALLAPSELAPAEGWYSLYFTDPSQSGAPTYDDGPETHLIEAIDKARYTIDVAVYHLELWDVRDALLRAHRRNVQVRIVTESGNIIESAVIALEDAGIPVIGDRREHLMHHKFIVIDRLEVWTGSMNLTLRGAYHNNNNLIRIRSNRVSQDYTREFEEMFLEDRFGALSRRDTPFPMLTLDGVWVEVYFSPDDGVAYRVVEVLNTAKESIDFMVFSFTSDELAEVMISRANAGISVRGVIEESQKSSVGSEFERFQELRMDVRQDRNPASMHHKVIIVDAKTVITGSYNFSYSAEERNDENVLILHDDGLAEQYLLEFERLYEEAMP
jgi:phosphatidylserine/phosphatidylglycerophosphate/cardiolipin synthase-like enzyme